MGVEDLRKEAQAQQQAQKQQNQANAQAHTNAIYNAMENTQNNHWSRIQGYNNSSAMYNQSNSANDAGSLSGYMNNLNSNLPVNRSNLMNAQQLSNQFGGIVYDRNDFLNTYNDATAAEYALKRKEYDQTANKFYGNLADTQQTALDTIRKANAAAIATGASRGVQAANELSSILGLQDTSVDEATQLAQDRANLVDQEAAAYAANAKSALSDSNNAKLQLGTLGSNIYATDTQFDIGALDYYANLNNAKANVMSAYEQAQANRYTADQNLNSTRYNADSNYNANKYTADSNYAQGIYNANATLHGNMYNSNLVADTNYYNSDSNLYGQGLSALSNIEAQRIAADAQIRAASISAASGGGSGSDASGMYFKDFNDAYTKMQNAYYYGDVATFAAAQKYLGAHGGDYTTIMNNINSDQNFGQGILLEKQNAEIAASGNTLGPHMNFEDWVINYDLDPKKKSTRDAYNIYNANYAARSK